MKSPHTFRDEIFENVSGKISIELNEKSISYLTHFLQKSEVFQEKEAMKQKVLNEKFISRAVVTLRYF